MAKTAGVDLPATCRALRRIIAPYESSFDVVTRTSTAFFPASKARKNP